METIYMLTECVFGVLVHYVIPQDKANRLRNVSCEPVYAESPMKRDFDGDSA